MQFQGSSGLGCNSSILQWNKEMMGSLFRNRQCWHVLIWHTHRNKQQESSCNGKVLNWKERGIRRHPVIQKNCKKKYGPRSANTLVFCFRNWHVFQHNTKAQHVSNHKRHNLPLHSWPQVSKIMALHIESANTNLQVSAGRLCLQLPSPWGQQGKNYPWPPEITSKSSSCVWAQSAHANMQNEDLHSRRHDAWWACCSQILIEMKTHRPDSKLQINVHQVHANWKLKIDFKKYVPKQCQTQKQKNVLLNCLNTKWQNKIWMVLHK